jgi:diaminopimelate decarboxylase
VSLPRAKEGDPIAVNTSGTHGLTASPIHFIDHAPPQEVLVEEGKARLVTRGFEA